MITEEYKEQQYIFVKNQSGFLYNTKTILHLIQEDQIFHLRKCNRCGYAVKTNIYQNVKCPYCFNKGKGVKTPEKYNINVDFGDKLTNVSFSKIRASKLKKLTNDTEKPETEVKETMSEKKQKKQRGRPFNKVVKNENVLIYADLYMVRKVGNAMFKIPYHLKFIKKGLYESESSYEQSSKNIPLVRVMSEKVRFYQTVGGIFTYVYITFKEAMYIFEMKEAHIDCDKVRIIDLAPYYDMIPLLPELKIEDRRTEK